MAEDLSDDDDVAVLVASGELDFHTSQQLKEHLLAHLDAGQPHLLLDLSTVTFIDSTAIGVLVGAAARVNPGGTRSLAIVCAENNEPVLRILNIAGVGSAIDLYHARAEAISALDAAA